MKKQILLAMFIGMSIVVKGNSGDSTLKAKAVQKMEVFARLLEYLASPAFDLTTKAEIERIIQTDYLENQDVRFNQDLNHQFGHSQSISVLQYFNQLRVLYPNGASLKSGEFEVSDIFYNEARDMYYLKFRCSRMFKGLNVMAKKEVKVNKMLDFQVKIMEGGVYKIEIVGNAIAEGPINEPLGLDKSIAELKKKTLGPKVDTQSEDALIAQNEKLIANLKMKGEAYESLVDEKKSPNKF